MKKNLLITIALFSFMLNLLGLNAQWEPFNNGLDEGTCVSSIAVKDDILFIGIIKPSSWVVFGGGIYYSSLNGNSWTLINDSLAKSICVTDIFITGNNIFASSFHRDPNIILSTDNGLTWNRKDNGIVGVTTLAEFDGKIFAGTIKDGIFISDDNGTNWKYCGLKDSRISDIAVNGRNIFVATHSGLFISQDSGSSWKQKSNFGVGSIAFMDDIIFLTGDDGINISIDNGDNWIRRIISDTTYIDYIAISGNNIFVSAGYFKLENKNLLFYTIFHSSDKGESWNQKHEGLIPMDQYSPFELFVNCNDIFALTCGYGIFRAKISDLITTSVENEKHSEYALSISPNPFSELSIINYQLSIPSNVKIDIYNSIGNKIATLVDEFQDAGRHDFPFFVDNFKLADGVYYIHLICNFESIVKTICILK